MTERDDDAIEQVKKMTNGGVNHVLECGGTGAAQWKKTGQAIPVR